MKNPQKAVILDRDGTLIIDKVYLNDPGKIEYLPDVFESMRRLRDAGFALVVATNQSGIARGIVSIENLDLIHQKMTEDFAQQGIFFKGFYYAPYAVESYHWMRKPNPGMLERAALDHTLDLNRSWMVGDRMTDVEAGRRAGTKTVLLEGVETPDMTPFAAPDAFVPGLVEAVDFILSNDI